MIRFFLNSLYLDLMDDLSGELACIEIGNGGKRLTYSDELIDRSLPEDWTWDPDDTGKGHHVYISAQTGERSTVHPARFGDPDIPLLPGWDRRLDAWGNLFFVDHNTKNAVREDPRWNPDIDKDTGLPLGWKAVLDHAGKTFYYREFGKMVHGTYVPQTMQNKSLRGKKILKRVPVEGEDPHLLDLNARPRDQARVQERARIATEAEKRKIRDMTDEEKRHYYSLFSAASKEDDLFITFAEAMAHCQGFGLPSGIIPGILTKSDDNQDKRLDVDEYATALHRIRVAIENEFATHEISPPTEEENAVYHEMFKQAKKPDQLVLTLDEVLELCKSYELPKDLTDRVWANADANNDQHYSPNEFAKGMHQVIKEYERREGKLGGEIRRLASSC